jgi:peptidoglycan/LPS O-acetylase OafA/YrhL
MATAVLSPAEILAKHRIPTLDGWRGVAILLVLVGHFSPSLYHGKAAWIEKIGGHGVAIFFVLSGFLITTLLAGEYERRGTVDLRQFYIRRFLRLMPCAWCYLGVMLFLSRAKVFTAKEIFGCLFFFRNYVSSPYLFTGHFWSLSIEEQFYLLWPSLLLFLGMRRAKWFAIVAVIVLTVWHLHADAIFVGCVLALVLPYLKNYLRPWMALPLFAGVAACVPAYHDGIPLHESILIALLLATTSTAPSRVFRVLDWKPLTFLGTISYGVYIWQQVFCLIAGPTIAGVLLALTALAVVSLASFYFIERPAIALGSRFRAIQ